MSRAKRRARRGEVGLVQLRSGAWGIRWGRALARELGVSPVESTETPDRAEAERILRTRQLDVFRRRGDNASVATLCRTAPAMPLDVLVTDFLKAYGAGELPGPMPRPNTVDSYVMHLLGARGGLVAFARTVDRTTSDRFDRVLVERWLEAEHVRAAPDTLRLKLIAARRLAAFAVERALMPPERAAAIRALRPPSSARGRARADGVPSEPEVCALLAALSPARWRPVAELQLRLGLRRSEVLAIRAEWLDAARGAVHVLVGDGFDTKSHAGRTIDGVDAETMALAREVVAMSKAAPFSVSGYVEAWKRACKCLARAGTPWNYRAKSHGLRSAYATASRMAGVPLPVVRDRMGHESERTTERHYLGRTAEPCAGPFAGVPRLAPVHVAKVIPLRRPNVTPASTTPTTAPSTTPASTTPASTTDTAHGANVIPLRRVK
jgi:integrase